MKLTDIIVSTKTLGKQMLLVDVTPVYIYKEGKRTSDIEGYKYMVALPDRSFEKIGIKIMGEQLIEKPKGYIEVTFEGLELFVYWCNGQYDLGATATGIHVKSA